MTEDEFIERVSTNPINRALLEGLPELGLKECWLVSGALFQSVWNSLTEREPTYGITDYDIAYYDADDLSWEAEDRVITCVAQLFSEVSAEIQVRNQARVHLWYADKFGHSYAPLLRTTDGIDRYQAVVSMVGLKPRVSQAPVLYAPKGLQDIARFQVQPNQSPAFDCRDYKRKAERWKSCWSELTITCCD